MFLYFNTRVIKEKMIISIQGVYSHTKIGTNRNYIIGELKYSCTLPPVLYELLLYIKHESFYKLIW